MKTFTFESLDSTNNQVKRLFQDHPDYISQGIVVVAHSQTHGRGTKGRVWHSESAGGLYYSLGFQPVQFNIEFLERYHHDVAVAIQRVILSLTSIHVRVKAPNDLYFEDKKIAGILMESSLKSDSGRLNYLIIGIGLNVNQTEFPDAIKDTASSLTLIGKQCFSKESFIEPITQAVQAVFS